MEHVLLHVVNLIGDNMKKKFIILLFTFILCGCSAEYEFSIDESLMEKLFIYDSYENLENITKTEEGSNEIAQTINRFERGYDFYNPSREFVNQDVNKIGYLYNMKHKINEFDATSIIRKCYEDININEENDYIEINTTNKFLCFELFNNLTSVEVIYKNNKNKKIDSNSDYINNNQYIWNINKNNKNNKPINLKIYKNENASSVKKNNFNFKMLIILIIFILLIFGLIIIKIINKIKKNNTI